MADGIVGAHKVCGHVENPVAHHTTVYEEQSYDDQSHIFVHLRCGVLGAMMRDGPIPPEEWKHFRWKSPWALVCALARGGHRPNPPARATASHPRRRCNAVEMPREMKVDAVAAEASFKRYMDPVRSLAPRPLARIPAPRVDRAQRRAQMTRATSLARGDE